MLAVTVVHVTSNGGSASCSVPAPIPSLPSRLRSLGGFDQPQDASDVPGLEAFAAQAAGAVAPRLIGTVPRPPVRVDALSAGQPDALVVALLSSGQGGQPRAVAGLVALQLDCAGRAYYAAVDDLSGKGASAPQAYPAVSLAQAAQTLGTSTPELVYANSPFAPRWRNPRTGSSITAFTA